jgi:predicted ArsR family transcriptional regulator
MKKAIATRESMNSVNGSASIVSDGWTFMTNHTHVLLCLYHNPDRRLRDVAQIVGITERMVQKVVADLVEAGYLQITKEGRRNHYDVNCKLKLRHSLEMHHTVGELLELLRPLEEVSEERSPNRRSARS